MKVKDIFNLSDENQNITIIKDYERIFDLDVLCVDDLDKNVLNSEVINISAGDYQNIILYIK